MFTELLTALTGSPSTVVAATVTPDAVTIEVIGAQLADEDTIFEVASITKVFTVMTAVSLQHEGALSLDDSLVDTWDGAPDIPLHQLANHTSGLKRLPPNMDRKYLKAHEEQPYAVYTRALLGEGVSQAKPKKAGKVRYSNFGMGLLGETLAVVTGQPYEELVTQHVLEPLGMTNTGFTAEPLQPRNRKGEPVPAWDFDALAGAGALRSNVTDMATFVRWWMDPQEPFTLMLEQSLGWQKAEGFIWHNGATYGSASFIGVDMENEVGVVMLSNVPDPLGLTITTTGFKAMERLRP